MKEVNGYRRFDKVMYENREYYIFGLRTSGYFNLKTIDGRKIRDSITCKKIKFIARAQGIIKEMKRVIPLGNELQNFPGRV